MRVKALTNKETKKVISNSEHPLLDKILYYKYFYILLIPAIVYYFIFAYIPMYGSLLAFKEFSYTNGILGGEWVGLKYFKEIFNDSLFIKSFINTLIISVGRIIFEFPVPIIFAILLNEIGRVKLQRFFQTVITFPHFISWIVVSSIMMNMLSDAGVLNQVIVSLGGQKINLLTETKIFRGLLYVTDNWKEMGWGTIIYLAAISGVSPELYESAAIDGAKRHHMMRYITWPAIYSVIGMMFILNIGNFMNAGFDQIINMYNSIVYGVADIIDTYVYRRTFVTGLDFSSSTAIGLFKSVVNLILLYIANMVVKKTSGEGIF